MGEITQRNSALAEQNADAVSALEQQSHSMAERASLFQLEDGGEPEEAEVAAVALPSIKPVPAPSPAMVERRRRAS